jgi:hypothetical protein
MDSTALISGVVGAMIGSLTSLATLIVQNTYQNRRESTRLLFETAFKDYELRILHLPENRAAFPIILAYHQKMIELIEDGKLTPDAARQILKMQSEMSAAVQSAVADLESSGKSHRKPHGDTPG